MVEVIIDSFTDVIKVFPALFLTFLLIDWLIFVLNKRNRLLSRISGFDVVGSLLGIIPQCGIPVSFAKLYANGYIKLGMLLAIFIANSDEALIIIGANPKKIGLVLEIILIKVLVAIMTGYLVNILIKEKRNKIKGCSLDCDCPKCRKDNNLFKSSLIHTLKITGFLFLTVFLINLGLGKLGENTFYLITGKNTFMQPVYASLFGLIPSCLSSVFLAESYIKGTLGFGAMLAGLSTNTGYGILVILKALPLKKALKIIFILEFVSILAGEIFFIIRG